MLAGPERVRHDEQGGKKCAEQDAHVELGRGGVDQPLRADDAGEPRHWHGEQREGPAWSAVAHAGALEFGAREPDGEPGGIGRRPDLQVDHLGIGKRLDYPRPRQPDDHREDEHQPPRPPASRKVERQDQVERHLHAQRPQLGQPGDEAVWHVDLHHEQVGHRLSSAHPTQRGQREQHDRHAHHVRGHDAGNPAREVAGARPAAGEHERGECVEDGDEVVETREQRRVVRGLEGDVRGEDPEGGDAAQALEFWQ
ncbi:hypothetical protein CIMIT_10860 [Corynebacterium imitans]|uniref:Uncharacterized protein n=1 Tax=Corynebacterium imitans TaxID=156978 RepID=A0A076NRM7_9CORY|nr:hypothetical protein CIMIT_10860 [Corynebacterium imitans]